MTQILGLFQIVPRRFRRSRKLNARGVHGFEKAIIKDPLKRNLTYSDGVKDEYMSTSSRRGLQVLL